jgi:GNAT superfamily N-acetyltransferase
VIRLCEGILLEASPKSIGIGNIRIDYLGHAHVFVLEQYRGRGLSKWLIACVMGHPDMQGLRRVLLGTRDAHGLYQRYGFTSLADPARFMEVFCPNLYQAGSTPNAVT